MLDLVGLVNHVHETVLPPIAERLAAHGVTTELLSPDAAAERWTGMRFRTSVLHIPESGRVRAADALVALRQAAAAAGARFLYETPALTLEVLGDDRAIVMTDQTEFVAQRVVVTAGTWSADLLGAHLRLPRLAVTHEQPAHFAIRDEHATWPSFNHWPDSGRLEDAYWFSKAGGMLTAR